MVLQKVASLLNFSISAIIKYILIYSNTQFDRILLKILEGCVDLQLFYLGGLRYEKKRLRNLC